MAKKERINIDNTGVDKLETFLQHNIKKLVIITTSLLVIFISVYLIYTINKISTTKKIDTIGMAEILISNDISIANFISLADSVPMLKDYIHLRGAEIYYSLDNRTASIKELQKVGGKYLEFSAGMLFDMGEQVVPSNYIKGDMRELWYYRTVLASDNNSINKNIDHFKLLYPDSPLVKMVENWSIK